MRRGDPGLVLSSSDWHKGVIGIGAARLVEQYQVPVVLIAIEGDEARGSARSVPDVDVQGGARPLRAATWCATAATPRRRA